jgi:hypothetical protein
MRLLRLLGIAAEAEVLRIGRQARRIANAVAIGCLAMLLLLGAVAFGHVAVWYWLRESLQARYVATIFAGADLLLACLCAILAARSTPGRVELEALALRRRALEDAGASMSIVSLVTRFIDLFMAVRQKP